jgi:diguanylate cyclase (GGDEF)-like protein
VTLSLGVATFPQNGANRDTLMQSADVALYRAKQEGRDRVCVAENR